MPVEIGTVNTFANPKADKAQVLKMLEECMEVFSAWENFHECTNLTDTCAGCDLRNGKCWMRHPKPIVDECADVITATCNLLAALGVDDMRDAMRACEERNRARGRM